MDRTIHIERYFGSLESMQRKWDKHARQNAFQGGSAEAFQSWQKEARTLLWGLLGLDMMELCAPEPVLESVELLEGGIRREKLRIQVEPGVWMPMFVLVPEKAAEGQRCFICPPGHSGAGKYAVAGCAEIPAVADKIKLFNYDYGLWLAKNGHVALCPDCRGFGERRDEALQGDGEEVFVNSSCFHLAHMAEPLGMTAAGLLTWDLMRLVDYIEARGEWDMDTLSCLGFSGGGMQTLWLAALDERVKLSVISGYMYGYKDSLLELNGNCSCNYVPSLWKHLDMGDIASLIAPRALIVQSCRDDHLNGPRGMSNVEEQVEVIRAAYALYGAEGRLAQDVCEGGHRWHEENIPALIDEVLGE